MLSPVPIGILVFLIALGIARGMLFLSGRDRSLAAYYFDAERPIQTRNRAFSLLPLSVGVLLLLASALSQQIASNLGGMVAFSMMGLAGIAWYVAARWTLDPPDRLKPGWLREREMKMPPTFDPSAARHTDRNLVHAAAIVALLFSLLGWSLALLGVWMSVLP